MKKLFYNATLNMDVHDESGVKTKAQIVKDFGGKLTDWKEISFDEKTHQCLRKSDGKFETKTLVKVHQELEVAAQTEITKNENAAQPILEKLGITKDEAQKLLKL